MRNPPTIEYQPFKVETRTALTIEHKWKAVDTRHIKYFDEQMREYLATRKEMIENNWKVTEHALGNVLLAIYEKWTFNEGDGDGKPASD